MKTCSWPVSIHPRPLNFLLNRFGSRIPGPRGGFSARSLFQRDLWEARTCWIERKCLLLATISATSSITWNKRGTIATRSIRMVDLSTSIFGILATDRLCSERRALVLHEELLGVYSSKADNTATKRRPLCLHCILLPPRRIIHNRHHRHHHHHHHRRRPHCHRHRLVPTYLRYLL